MSTIEDLSIGIGVESDDLESQVGRIGDIMEFEFAQRIADSVSEAGQALEDFAREQQDTNVQVRQLAESTGLGEDAMRDLAAETSNATFPLEDVLDLMETGRQRGIDSADELQRYAEFWDMVGDATGESGPKLGEAAVALQAVGIAAGEESEAVEAMGFIHQETTSSVDEFLQFLERTGPELRDMGADVDDAAAILGVLEHELGMSGRTARQEFRSAVNEADGDLDAMMDTLGVSTESFESMREQVGESGEVLQRNADIVADSMTPMQNLESMASDLMMQYGGLAEAAATMAPLMMALGPIMKVVAAAKFLLNGAFLASPITWIVLAIVAAIAILVAIGFLVWKHWDTILDAIGAAWQWLQDKVIAPFVDFMVNTVWKNGIKRVVDLIIAAVRMYINIWRTVFRTALSIIKGVIDFIRGIPGTIRRAFSRLANIITSPFRSAFNAVARLWNNTLGKLSFEVPSWVPGMGGRGFSMPTIPTFHDGGVVPGRGEQLALLEGGEGVLSRDAMRSLDRGGPRGGDGASLPDEFVAEATLDLGEGISQVVDIKFRRKDRHTRGRALAGSGSLR